MVVTPGSRSEQTARRVLPAARPLPQAQLRGGEGTVPGDQGQGDWMAPHPAGPVELGQDRKRIGGPASGADAAAYVSEQRGRDRSPGVWN